MAIASPRVRYAGLFYVLDVLEGELDGIYGCLTRDENHCWSLGYQSGGYLVAMYQKIFFRTTRRVSLTVRWMVSRVDSGFWTEWVCATYRTSALYAVPLSQQALLQSASPGLPLPRHQLNRHGPRHQPHRRQESKAKVRRQAKKRVNTTRSGFSSVGTLHFQTDHTARRRSASPSPSRS